MANMRLFKRGKYWHVEFDKYHKKSLRTTNKKEAERIFAELKKAALLKKLIKLDKTCTLKEFIEEYLNYAEKNLAENTVRIVKNSFKYLLQIINPEISLKTISHKDIEKFIDFRLSQGVKKTTINMDLRHLKAAFNKALEWELIEKNPFSKIKLFKIKKQFPKFFTPEDIEKIKQTITNEKWLNLFEFYIYTGGRRNEVLNLTWNDITDTHIIFRETKSGSERKVPITPQLRKTIERMKKNKNTIRFGKLFHGFDEKYVSKKFTQIFKKAGFEGYHLHHTRHTFASLLIQNGVDLYIISKVLGHSDYSVTQIYAHLSDSKIFQKIIKKIDW